MKVGQRVKIINKRDSDNYGKKGTIGAWNWRSVFLWFYSNEVCLLNEPGNIKPGYYWYRDNPNKPWIPIEVTASNRVSYMSVLCYRLEELQGDFVELIPPGGED